MNLIAKTGTNTELHQMDDEKYRLLNVSMFLNIHLNSEGLPNDIPMCDFDAQQLSLVRWAQNIITGI